MLRNGRLRPKADVTHAAIRFPAYAQQRPVGIWLAKIIDSRMFARSLRPNEFVIIRELLIARQLLQY